MSSRVLIALSLLYIALYILPLNQRPLLSPDEARYAEVPREMIARGDWIVPKLNGLDYFEKPSLGYIVIATSFTLFGSNAFALRLPSALAAGLCALALAVFMQRRFSQWPLTALSVSIFLSMGEVYAVGTYAVLDMPFTAALSWSIVCGLEAHEEARFSRRQLWLLAFGFSAGLAFMIKGLLAIVLPILIIAPLQLREGRWRQLLRDAWLPLITCALTVLPWALLIHSRAPDFWNQFFWVEHIKRFSSKDAQHPQPFFYFIPILLAGALPWTILAPLAIRAQIQSSSYFSDYRRQRRALLFWAILPFLFFSASRGKLGTYILPCFAPLAALLALALSKIKEPSDLRLLGRAAQVLASLCALAPLVLLALVSWAPAKLAIYTWAESPSLALITLSTALGAGGFWKTSRILRDEASAPSRLTTAITIFALSALPIYSCFHFCLPETIAKSKSATDFLQSIAPELRQEMEIITDKRLFHALCWTLQRDDLSILNHPGELAYGLSRPGCGTRLLLSEDLRRKLLDPKRRQTIALLINRSYFEEMKATTEFSSAHKIIKNEPYHILAIFQSPNIELAEAQEKQH